ncbi:hypothetical protein HYT45_01380 [Candidatus Uhrbacteria bacterium]|nr:hypothetical protein [Candidatus Uhrbacteria bacterium]
MDAPYRNDEVAKLLAENEKLREQNDKLMWRFSALRKWPRVAVYLLIGIIPATVIGVMSNNSALDENQIEDISRKVVWRVSRVAGQYRREFAQEVARDLHSRVALDTNAPAPAPARACSACPVCANGTDERVLGMNKVVSGTVSNRSTGPLSQDWKFFARAGDDVIFRLKIKSGNFYSGLVLADAQGNVFQNHDLYDWSGNATIRYRFFSAGTYTLRCMNISERGEEGGSYTLSATRVGTR